MNPTFYYVLHVASAMLLLGVTFAIFGGLKDRADCRKKTLMFSGILSFVMLVGGFGLASKALGMPNPATWPVWLWVKVVCWLALSALAGIAYRRRENVSPLVYITMTTVIIALVAVYTKF